MKKNTRYSSISMRGIISPKGVKITSWVIILIQLLTPLLISASSVARADEYKNMKKSTLGPQPTVDHTVNKTIPSLGNNNTESPEPAPAPDAINSGNVMQAGQILSSDNITNSSINYAKSVGEGLINQQINDWLNQKGTARVSVDSDSKLSGDMLLPIVGNNDSLLFTQLGMHGNEDRNTANLGFGYRQYIGAWIYGINTFYDYDYTGKNARLGVGGEAWTDYLKLAANSYYGLTGWHQSHLSDMEDYDERPANGFDLRAEAYLPSYPQLGANIKYEQYFGSGIDLGTGTDPDDLKDNPKALTVGLNYTPVPLITLKGEHSVGDKNESLIGLDVTYRFGVPWEQQISTDSVDTLRSLKGSMFEFVDRNYEIVMQYRKQDLLHITLPDNVNAKAAETIILPLTVTKDKYGLKDVDWTASPEFIANGGTFRQLSLTQLEVKLPTYVYNQRTNAAQQYVIKAVGVDNNGNSSNTATTTLNVAPSKSVISKLIISPSGSLPANDTDYFTVTAIVVDEQGQPAAAEAIKFNIDDLKDSTGQSAATLFKDGHSDGQELTANTDSQGKATIYVRSKLAKEGTITATMSNGNYLSGRLNFVTDTASAQISDLEVINNNAPSDGQSTDKLKVTVKNGNNTPLANATVELSASHGAILVGGSTVVTDAEGQATVLVANLTGGDTTITARINDSTKTQVITFVAGKSTATIAQGDLTTTQDAVANGIATNKITAKITDANANTVSNVAVHFTVSNGAQITTVIGVTGDDGIATATVTSLKAETYTVTAQIPDSGNSAQVDTRFIADSSTATIIDSNLTIDPNGALDNGVNTDNVEAIVTDANGNLVPNATVNFVVASGATITTVIGTTGTDGKATAIVTSNTSGKYAVTATVNGHSASKDAVFIADSGTATITSGNLKVTADNALANGTAMDAVQAKVTDAHGNTVPNVTVNFTADHGAIVTTASAVTDVNGLASTTLSNTTSGTTNIVAAVNGTNQNVNTNFAPDDSTATIINGNFVVTQNNAKANGTDSNKVQATVTDANGNPVPNTAVSFTADNGATVVTTSITTDAQGLASTSLTNVKAGITKVTATVNSHSEAVDTTFVADDSTATIVSGDLTVTVDKAKANGADSNKVQATVIDANGNPVPNTAVSFTADNGATVVTTSITTDAQGLASTTLTNVKAGITNVTATVNSHSQAVDTMFVADDSTATITGSNLTVIVNNAKADGVDTNMVQAKVTDAQGNSVPNATVSFTADNGAGVATSSATTDAQGIASTNLTNITAGITKVTASINGTSQTVDTSFAADGGTSTIINGNLTVTLNNAKADGAATNAVQAKVTDAQGNAVPNVDVSFSANNGATVISATAKTDMQGLASTTLTNVTAGTTKVTAAINGNRQTVDTTFIADDSTATIVTGDLTVIVDKAKANGTNSNKVQAKVTDATGNPVPNTAISFTADNGATVVTTSLTTDDQGQATTTVTNVKSGITKVTATVNSKSQTVDTTFIADDSTATIVTGDLTVTVDKATANGTDSNKVQAKVTDATGNPVPNTAVSFTADNGATVVTTSVTTDDQGLATTTLTNVKAGITKVTATVNGHSQTVDTTFAADITTAAVSTVTLNDSKTDKIANGSDSFTYTAIVKDAHGNLVSNATVNWSQDKGNAVTLQVASSVTDVNGKATMVLTSTTTEALLVQVSASLTNGTVVNADKQVNFKQQLVEVHGATRNAVNGAIIPNVKIDFSLSENNANAEYSVTSGTDGKYKISIPQGVYQAKASATGFITLDSTLDIQTVTDLQHDFVLSPDLDGKAARIVLTWNKTPGDLDAILFVPSVDNPSKLIKVYYNAKSPSGADAKLDKDDQNGYGPETITIDSMHSGVYCYVVNNTFEGNSGAKVKLYLSDGTSQEFDAQDSTMDGWDNWTVFKIDTTSGQAKISTVNTFSNGADDAQCH